MTATTRQISERNLSQRLALSGPRDELKDLADTIDGLLGRLEAHVAEQQRFAANASHELRTPLATTQALLDVARNDPGRADGELVERLAAVNTRAIDLTEALLLLSRADQRLVRPRPGRPLPPGRRSRRNPPPPRRRSAAWRSRAPATWPRRPAPAPSSSSSQPTSLHNAIVHNLPAGRNGLGDGGHRPGSAPPSPSRAPASSSPARAPPPSPSRSSAAATAPAPTTPGSASAWRS